MAHATKSDAVGKPELEREARYFRQSYKAEIIGKLIAATAKEISERDPNVLWIRHRFGDEAIFFKVMLKIYSGAASVKSTECLHEFRDFGMLVYTNYRIEAEQEKLKDPEWERPV
jgi:hypothetical protein